MQHRVYLRPKGRRPVPWGLVTLAVAAIATAVPFIGFVLVVAVQS